MARDLGIEPIDEAGCGDRLERICGLADISSADRRRLRSELEYAAYVLARIDRGAGFCEDRGFGWTAEMERNEGTERLFASLRAWPILRRLLPRLRHFRHQQDPIIGLGTVPSDDVAVALLLLDGQYRFDGRFGEGWDERTIEVRLDADAIHMRERTCASDMGDRPFASSEATADYAESSYGPFWNGLKGKLAADVAKPAAALAERMGHTVVPCDLCGRASKSFSIVGSVLTYSGPTSEPVSVNVPGDALRPLRRAMAAQDMVAVRALNPAWTDGYCTDRDLSLCSAHIGRLQQRHD